MATAIHRFHEDFSPGPVSDATRVCFLFNAQIHQLLHGLTTAIALARHPGFAVDIRVASHAHLDLANAILPKWGPRPGLSLLGSPLVRAWSRLRGAAIAPKRLVLRSERHALDRYDAIVVPERTSLQLRGMGVTHPRLIHVDHGAGDRAIGYDPRIRQFDFVLVAGDKQRTRMLREGLIRSGDYAITGYPKFDAADALRDPRWTPFAQPRPIILYNPHFSPALGSWERIGIETVMRIAESGRFNLIVAPHIRLCDGRAVRREVSAALRPLAGRPDVHVDLGSQRSADMSYTSLADIYLGEVSSQVYEFLRRPRPCVFLNSGGIAWQRDENYAHWRFGDVVDTPDALLPALDRAIRNHGRYRRIQEAGFRSTFSLGDVPSSERAANAIADFLARDGRTAG